MPTTTNLTDFTFHHKPIQRDGDNPIVHYLFMLGTDTTYQDQKGYIEGELCGQSFERLPSNATIVDGPKQTGPYCYDADIVPSNTVAFMLEQLMEYPLTEINVTAHSRGSIGALILAHELDRIKESLAHDSLDSLESIKKIVLNSTSTVTNKILTSKLQNINEEQWRNLKTNIQGLNLNLFLLDPVPGIYNSLIRYRWKDQRICKPDHFSVAKIVRKIHVQYAQDERTHQFDTIVVKAASADDTQITTDSLPGHHGTASGNIGDRPQQDTSTFTKLYKLLEEKISHPVSSEEDDFVFITYPVQQPTASLSSTPSAATGVNPRPTRSPFRKCITEKIDWASLSQEQQNNLKKEVLELIKKELEPNYYNLIVSNLTDTASTQEYIGKLYQQIRSDFNSMKKLTELKRLDFFESNPTGPTQLSPREEERLTIYKRISTLKKSHFQAYRKTFYDGLGGLSQDQDPLGRQVQCGDTIGRLQDYIWIPHDDSPYINMEHRDLAFKELLFKIVERSTTSSSELMSGEQSNVQKISSLIHNIIKITREANKRTSPHLAPRATQSSPIRENYSSEFTQLITAYLNEIIADKDESSINQLFEIVNRLKALAVKDKLFTPKKLLTFSEMNPSAEVEHLILQIINDGAEQRPNLEESVKAALQPILEKSINNVLENQKNKLNSAFETVEKKYHILLDTFGELIPTAKQSRLSTIEQDIKTLAFEIDFVIKAGLKFDDNYIDQLQQKKDTLQDLDVSVKVMQLQTPIQEIQSSISAERDAPELVQSSAINTDEIGIQTAESIPTQSQLLYENEELKRTIERQQKELAQAETDRQLVLQTQHALLENEQRASLETESTSAKHATQLAELEARTLLIEEFNHSLQTIHLRRAQEDNHLAIQELQEDFQIRELEATQQAGYQTLEQEYSAEHKRIELEAKLSLEKVQAKTELDTLKSSNQQLQECLKASLAKFESTLRTALEREENLIRSNIGSLHLKEMEAARTQSTIEQLQQQLQRMQEELNNTELMALEAAQQADYQALEQELTVANKFIELEAELSLVKAQKLALQNEQTGTQHELYRLKSSDQQLQERLKEALEEVHAAKRTALEHEELSERKRFELTHFEALQRLQPLITQPSNIELEKNQEIIRASVSAEESESIHSIQLLEANARAALIKEQINTENQKLKKEIENLKKQTQQTPNSNQELENKLAAWQSPKEVKASSVIIDLWKVLIDYETHLTDQNHKNSTAKAKSATVKQLKRILANHEVLPSERVKNYHEELLRQKPTLSKHQNSTFARFIRDSLRIILTALSGVFLYRIIKGESPGFFKPSHGQKFTEESEKITTPSKLV